MKTPLSRSDIPLLPPPATDALAHSDALREFIAEDIARAGGWIDFARFMELALYAPGLGYYSAGSRKFGAAGDFVTAPEISSLFGQTLAPQIAAVLDRSGGAVLEAGPGSGKLACDVLTALHTMDRLPERYLMLEVSADLRERQRERIATLPHPIAARVEWLDSLPTQFDGVVLANEVLDVLPVHLIRFDGNAIFERGVAARPGTAHTEFVWEDHVLAAGALSRRAHQIASEHLGGNPPAGYVTEIAPAAAAWTASLAAMLGDGALLFIDYGFRAAEYYHPTRHTGTLMCHYRHFAHPDPFHLPGLQDITSHVDFTAVADAASAAGAQVLGFTTQGAFLIGSGIMTLLERTDPGALAEYLPLTNQINRLVSPAEMGEFFKVIAFGKGKARDIALPGFSVGRPLPL